MTYATITRLIPILILFYGAIAKAELKEINIGDHSSDIVIDRKKCVGYISMHLTNGEIIMVDLNNGAITKRIKVGNKPFEPLLDANQNRLYVLSKDDSTLYVIDTELKKIASNIKLATYSDGGAVLSDDKKKLYIPHNYEGKISVIDTTKNLIEQVINVGKPIGGQLVLYKDKLYIKSDKDGNLIIMPLNNS